MIISALSEYYDIIADDNENIPSYGFCNARVTHEIHLTENGEIIFPIIPLEEKRDNKVLPKYINVPAQPKRASNIESGFLCEKFDYVFGNQSDSKSMDRHGAFVELHEKILTRINHPYSKAMKRFLSLSDGYADLDEVKSLNEQPCVFVFSIKGRYIHEIDEFVEAWLEEVEERDNASTKMQCSITGEMASIARLHPVIKGLRNGQKAGTSLVSFNNDAYVSYGKEQGDNAPISTLTAFKYTACLNFLLSDRRHHIYVGDDTAVVYWAETKEPKYLDFINTYINPIQDIDQEEQIRGVLESYKQGSLPDISQIGIQKQCKFYLLGLNANASRIAIRFFCQTTFEDIISKLLLHTSDLLIEREFDAQKKYIPVWMIIKELSKPKSSSESSPLLSGSILRSIFEGTLYPRGMLTTVINRVRCDQDEDKMKVKINYVRASIIKAYLTRMARINKNDKILEVLKMSLNVDTNYMPYLLGRLFAVLEKIQKDANPNISATIKDRYFSSACATPASVFPTLIKLSQSNLSKIEYRLFYDKKVGEIIDMFDKENFPKNLSLEDQGVFIVGYYHQMNNLYMKQE
ncbi:MAG: type I-C CRISPR-associated protein Cas8c/Csd1 [Candidatus Izemoplasmatales bacterium]